ncbi:virulence RhuM family protein [Microgenomates group bacterium]|nr:virulence RhuM family protein [Microgenomates group bacterium]
MENKVAIYQSKNGDLSIEVKFDGETVWLNRHQIAELFGRDVKTIGKHINNALDEELEGFSTVAKFATVQNEGGRSVERQIEHYSLDAILSVGYRVKSREGVRFRIWANKVLKSYLLKGVAINQKRLDQLNKILEITSRSEITEVAGVADVVKNYTTALNWLEKYDEGELPVVEGKNPDYQLTYEEARSVLDGLEFSQTNSNFARERNESFKGVIAALYQTFGGQELYASVEEKAANLLYLIIKDHPFYDGNKRSAAALFVYFLAKNKSLNNINNNTLTAIALMAALSKSEEKEMIILLVMNFLAS